MEKKHAHFKDQDALLHVIQAQKDGIIASSEVHGQEPSGKLSAFIDALRDTAIFCLIVYTPLYLFKVAQPLQLEVIAFTGLGWTVWKTGRSALLGWSRLERLHRIVDQEKWEIEHHRQQEREELTELYRAKGFEGKLLEDVIDVLMSDGDRLLRVMIEEELGLTLEKQDHPLLQAGAALFGGLFALVSFLVALFFLPPLFTIVMACSVLIFAGYLGASVNDNQKVSSVIWHLGLGLLSFGVVYFLIKGLS